MSDNEFAINEEPLSVPPSVENVSLEKTLIENMRLRKRLQELIAQNRTESRAAMRALLLKLLDVADALDRILLRAPDPASEAETRQWNNIRLTRKLLDKALQLQQVAPLEVLGKEADPALCEVEDAEERPDLPDGTVIQELIKGYRWGDESEPLRPAVVIVSTNTQANKVEAD
jgi:molecular chaperone GrpE (heat shock protein)